MLKTTDVELPAQVAETVCEPEEAGGVVGHAARVIGGIVDVTRRRHCPRPVAVQGDHVPIDLPGRWGLEEPETVDDRRVAPLTFRRIEPGVLEVATDGDMGPTAERVTVALPPVELLMTVKAQVALLVGSATLVAVTRWVPVEEGAV